MPTGCLHLDTQSYLKGGVPITLGVAYNPNRCILHRIVAMLVNWWYWCQPGSETTPLLPVSCPRWGRGRRRRTSENTASWKTHENVLNLNYDWKTFIFEMGGTPCCGCPLPTVMASTLAPKFLQSAHPSPPSPPLLQQSAALKVHQVRFSKSAPERDNKRPPSSCQTGWLLREKRPKTYYSLLDMDFWNKWQRGVRTR